jgi:hypothetical protein
VGIDWSQNVAVAAQWRKKNLDARAGGLNGLDEDEFIFVGNDHSIIAGNRNTSVSGFAEAVANLFKMI